MQPSLPHSGPHLCMQAQADLQVVTHCRACLYTAQSYSSSLRIASKRSFLVRPPAPGADKVLLPRTSCSDLLTISFCRPTSSFRSWAGAATLATAQAHVLLYLVYDVVSHLIKRAVVHDLLQDCLCIVLRDEPLHIEKLLNRTVASQRLLFAVQSEPSLVRR